LGVGGWERGWRGKVATVTADAPFSARVAASRNLLLEKGLRRQIGRPVPAAPPAVVQECLCSPRNLFAENGLRRRASFRRRSTIRPESYVDGSWCGGRPTGVTATGYDVSRPMPFVVTPLDTGLTVIAFLVNCARRCALVNIPRRGMAALGASTA